MASPGGFTDYVRACGTLSQSFYQMLARCIVLDDDHFKLNTVIGFADCEDLHSFWTCDNNHIDPEQALIDNVFALDDCGNLAIKILFNGDVIGDIQPG